MSAVTAIPTDSVGSTDERELLVRVQAGDRGAFDLLVRRYLPRARVIARRLLQDPMMPTTWYRMLFSGRSSGSPASMFHEPSSRGLPGC